MNKPISMKLSLLVPVITLLAAGSWSLHKDAPLAHETAVSSNGKADRAGMRISSPTLYRGETLTLYFNAPNPAFLGVIDPAGHFFYLVYPSEYASAGLHPLVNSEKFAALHSLKIDPASLTADPYTYGVYHNQPVFIQPGVYTFLLGDNLHVDDPTLVEKVRVQYYPGARPAAAAPENAVAASN